LTSEDFFDTVFPFFRQSTAHAYLPSILALLCSCSCFKFTGYAGLPRIELCENHSPILPSPATTNHHSSSLPSIETPLISTETNSNPSSSGTWSDRKVYGRQQRFGSPSPPSSSNGDEIKIFQDQAARPPVYTVTSTLDQSIMCLLFDDLGIAAQWRTRSSQRESVVSRVGGSCSSRDLPGRWQFRRVLPGLAARGSWQMKKKVFFLVQCMSNICISPPRISGNLVKYQQGPRLQVVRPGHELLVPLSQVHQEITESLPQGNERVLEETSIYW